MKSEQVVQQNKASGNGAAASRGHLYLHPQRPYVRSTSKDSAAHRGPAGAGSVTAWRHVKKERQSVGRLPSTCSLSSADGTEAESNSIGNQRSYLHQWAAREGWQIVGRILDDGHHRN